MGLALAVTTEETRKEVAVAVMRGMGMGAVAAVVLLVAGALPMDVLEEATMEASQVVRWAGWLWAGRQAATTTTVHQGVALEAAASAPQATAPEAVAP